MIAVRSCRDESRPTTEELLNQAMVECDNLEERGARYLALLIEHGYVGVDP